MCSCDDNPPKGFATVIRKAAKEHRCYECGEVISKGDLYQLSSGVWEGGPDSFKWCDTCTTVHNLAKGILDDDAHRHRYLNEGFCFTFGNLLECVDETFRYDFDDLEEAALSGGVSR